MTAEIKIPVSVPGIDEATAKLGNFTESINENASAVDRNKISIDDIAKKQGDLGKVAGITNMAVNTLTTAFSALNLGTGKAKTGLEQFDAGMSTATTVISAINPVIGTVVGTVGTLVSSLLHAQDAANAAAQAIHQAFIEQERLAQANGVAEMDQTAEAIRGVISEVDLLAVANRNAAQGFVLTSQQMEQATRAATVYANANGGTVLDSLNKITDALRTGNAPALRSFGIAMGETTTAAGATAVGLRSLNVMYSESRKGVRDYNAELLAQGHSQLAINTVLNNSEEQIAGMNTTVRLQAQAVLDATNQLNAEADASRRSIAVHQALNGSLNQATTEFREMGDAISDTEEAVNALVAAQTELHPLLGTLGRPVAPRAAHGGGGGVNREEEENNRLKAEATAAEAKLNRELQETVRLQTEAARIETERLNLIRTTASAMQALASAQNANIAFNNTLDEISGVSTLKAKTIAEDELNKARAITEETQKQADILARKNIASQAIQDTVNGNAQSIYQSAVSRQQHLTQLQEEYNQAVADGDSKKAAAAQAEMKSVGSLGKAIKNGLKDWLKNFAIQTAFKGLAAEAEAIGLAFTNPPAAAGKAVEGATLLGIAAAAGGVSAAVGGGASKGGGTATAATQPSGKNSESSGSGGDTIVINIQGQALATQAQIGSEIKLALDAHQARYGT